MAFDKVGSFRVATSERLESPGDWPNILAGRDGEITPPADSESVRTASRPSTPGEVVAQIADPDRWVFVHTTIMASVDLEEGSEFLVKEASEKWINDNGDAWERTQLLKDFGSFRNAAVYVEHNQHPEHAKGKVFDVVARDMGDTVLVDVLFGVDKRHDDLVNNITAGILNAVSMGCSTAFTKCSVCGNLAHTETITASMSRTRRGSPCRHTGGRGRLPSCASTTISSIAASWRAPLSAEPCSGGWSRTTPC